MLLCHKTIKSETYHLYLPCATTDPSVALVNIDGDLDLIKTSQLGEFSAFLNTGDAVTPWFDDKTYELYGLSKVDAANTYDFARIMFADIANHNGDMDLFMGLDTDLIHFIENTSELAVRPNATKFLAATTNPYSLTRANYPPSQHLTLWILMTMVTWTPFPEETTARSSTMRTLTPQQAPTLPLIRRITHLVSPA
jgi:hypothetical protein